MTIGDAVVHVFDNLLWTAIVLFVFWLAFGK